jgi:Tol biopolymer transport system component
MNGRTYAWAGNGAILEYSGARDGSGQFYLHNLAAGTKTRLRRLESRYNSRHGGLTRNIEVSPDGKWLLWIDTPVENGSIGPYIGGCSLDGRQRIAAGVSEMYANWIPRSTQWLAFEENDNGSIVRARIRSATGTVVKSIRVRTPRPDFDDLVEVHIVRRPDGVRLVTFPAAKDSPAAWMVTWSLRTSLVHESKRTVATPADAIEDGIQLSSDGTRIAWCCDPAHRGSAEAIWMTQIGTGRMTNLGEVEMTPDEPSTFRFTIRWSPDDKRISFVHDHALWVVDVPPIARHTDSDARTTKRQQRCGER